MQWVETPISALMLVRPLSEKATNKHPMASSFKTELAFKVNMSCSGFLSDFSETLPENGVLSQQ